MNPRFFLFFTLTTVFAKADLVVYTYDSLSGKHGLGKAIEEKFTKETKNKIRWVAFGSSGEALGQFLLEGKKSSADVLFGIDQSQMATVLNGGLFTTYNKKVEKDLSADALVDSKSTFIPFDFGYLAFIYDSTRTKIVPTSLNDLATNIAFHKKVIVQDPRTSSLGLGLLVWSHAIFEGDSANIFWKSFSRQFVTISPGWSAAYGMFLKNEADFVLSYTTSPAYHIEEEKKTQYKAAIFPEGHYKQVELAGITKSSKQKELASKFLEVILSPEIQAKVATKQWMYPALKTAKVPDSFNGLPIPKSIKIDSGRIEKEKKKWLQDWALSVVKAQ